jgi:hypothetical protein
MFARPTGSAIMPASGFSDQSAAAHDSRRDEQAVMLRLI